ncbi:uncharacterized protein K441DRAFT_599828 [Cenococcum geophilum 1.58]|uniref:uncharacterized protein n=1 Tax=Cenococcum geophilum 1.58 TaxID=794803 RepID=UPI0035902789|nr:hypothetical protein K441DRAFT_599828 [Cenococcum geophilum 1.58]
MSGIEIAGLVLGAIPLVISALEHYEDLIDPAKVFVKFQGELGRAIRELRNQHTLFEQSMEVLLQPITTDRELSEMIDNTNSELWQDPAIEQELRSNLGKAYPSYMRTVNDIQKIMIGIAIKLDNFHGVENLNQDGLEAIISQHAAAKVDGKLQKFEISKRVKFTMKKKRIKESLEELQRCIEMLDKFQVKADKIAAADELYKSDGRFRVTLPVDTIRENAKKLYNVLSKTWCSTHSSHSAGLLLEQRLIKKPKRGGPGWQRKRLPVDHCDTNRFSLSLLQSPASTSKKWLDVEIRLVESAAREQSGSAVQVRISAPPSSSVTTTLAPLPYHNPSQLQIVTNLCSILQSPCYPCIGFCLDNDGHLRGAYNAQRSVAYVDEVSLEDILKKNPGTFSQQERYNLSITLTSSLLQLSNTPWLQETWNKTDIIFLRAKDECPLSRIAVDVKHPYLTREHKQTTTFVRRGSGEPKDSSKVVALGIMLLEICYGLPIEELLRPEDLGPNNRPTEISYLQAARRWLMGKEGDGEFSFAFVKAIWYCLQCFMNPSASLSDQAFLKTIKEHVLVPLEEEMNMLLFGPLVR